jgi:hypothetical protein
MTNGLTFKVCFRATQYLRRAIEAHVELDNLKEGILTEAKSLLAI